MKLGVFTALLQDRPLEDVLRLVASLGYETIELPAWRGGGHLDLDAVEADRGRSLREMVARHGLAISAISNGYDYVLSFEHEDPVMSAEDGLEKAIEYLRPLMIRKPLTQAWW